MSLNVRMPTEMHEELVSLAEDEDRTLNGQIVHALRFYLSQKRRPNTPRLLCAEQQAEYTSDTPPPA